MIVTLLVKKETGHRTLKRPDVLSLQLLDLLDALFDLFSAVDRIETGEDDRDDRSEVRNHLKEFGWEVRLRLQRKRQ